MPDRHTVRGLSRSFARARRACAQLGKRLAGFGLALNHCRPGFYFARNWPSRSLASVKSPRQEYAFTVSRRRASSMVRPTTSRIVSLADRSACGLFFKIMDAYRCAVSISWSCGTTHETRPSL